MSSPLPPGSTIGILGGGQLGRMLSLAASRLGLRTHIFDPAENGPAAQVAHAHTRAEFDDHVALAAFANACDALTYEWENVPVDAARLVASHRPLAPGVTALATAQDRLAEKRFLSELPGVEVAPFRHTTKANGVHSLRRAANYLGFPFVVKTQRGGYDGKGQATVRSEGEIDAVWEALGGMDLVVEGFVEFTREVSLICVRGQDGEVRSYSLTENVHRNHILHTSTAPVAGGEGAAEIAKTIVDALDYVGVIGVEFFDTRTPDGKGGLLVNEIAPRVHNSGHWTQDAGCVDQFENHIRAVAGWPLGSTEPTHAVRMTNLIGGEVERAVELSGTNARLHLYGKREARPGRKMGHVNERIS